MNRLPHSTLVAILACCPLAILAQDQADLRKQVEALATLTEAPKTHPAEGFESSNGAEAIFFDALPWKGEPTRVFAWIGLPKEAPKPVPGVVLVHGGGGTAVKEWVEKWNARGYAAISIAVEGQTDIRMDPADPRSRWRRHELGGPARSGIYHDSAEPIADQWIFHAVADTILANSLLRAQPGVDPDKVGLMGVSWGGIITSTVIGIDQRFAFAIPTYGCGNLADVPNQYGRALGDNSLYREVWDPILRLNKATMPTLWFSWTGDAHFPMGAFSSCYAKASGPHMVALVPNMRHGHGPAWNRPESYAFADSIVKANGPWGHQTGLKVDGDSVRVRFASTKPIDSAVLTWSRDTGPTSERTWSDSAATIRAAGEEVVVEATLPAGVTAWFVNLTSGELITSSDFQGR